MPAPKGRPKPIGAGGSRKGIPNKVTSELKGMIMEALSEAGGKDYLLRQANENPVAFLGLVGKIIPKEDDRRQEENRSPIIVVRG